MTNTFVLPSWAEAWFKCDVMRFLHGSLSRYRRLGFVDFARLANHLRNLVAIASNLCSIHDMGNSWMVRSQLSLDTKLVQLQLLAPCNWTFVHCLKHLSKGLYEVQSGCGKVLRDLDNQAKELHGAIAQGETLP